ncbi:MAG TPA: hypothetical protein DF614_03325 [Methylococcaceae bacterium]|nr:hypothetical protein [Methylococcaceae bacterium]
MGRSIRDNSEIPPSVLISQLRETIEKSWRLDESGKSALLHAITLEHPLQPFSLRYIEKNRDPRLFTYAHEWFTQTTFQKNTVQSTAIAVEATPLALTTLALGRFLKAPVKTYCIYTLKFTFEDSAKALRNDDEPFMLNHLEHYLFCDELLNALKDSDERVNDNLDAFFEHQQSKMTRQGVFPLGNFKNIAFEHIANPVKAAWLQYQTYLAQWPTVCEALTEHYIVRLDNGVTVQLSGQFNTLRQKGHACALIDCSAQTLLSKGDIKYHHFCTHWVNHLLLCATNTPVQSIIIGADTVCNIEPLTQDVAEKYLKDVLSAWQAGLQSPLPVAVKTAFAYLPKADMEKAKKTYEGDGFNHHGEVGNDAYLQRFFAHFELLRLSKTPEGFNHYAEILYRPLLTHIAEIL